MMSNKSTVSEREPKSKVKTEIKYCIACRQKDPPVDTILVPGENITPNRYYKSKIYYCNECIHLKQALTRAMTKGIWAKHEVLEMEIQLEQFYKEWNDPEFAKVKELADKIVLVWNKYHKRSPEKGHTREIICEIIFPELWNVSVETVINDMLNSRNDSPIIRNRYKEMLYLFIPAVIDAFRDYYRRKAENKWDGLVDAINHKYAGHEKIIAIPEYVDKLTGRHQHRWFLLSHKPELDERIEINLRKKDRVDYNINQEVDIVKKHEANELKIQQEEQEHQSEAEKDSNESGSEE